MRCLLSSIRYSFMLVTMPRRLLNAFWGASTLVNSDSHAVVRAHAFIILLMLQAPAGTTTPQYLAANQEFYYLLHIADHA